MPATPAYQKKWRESHPHYFRDWMRRNRGTGLIGRGTCIRGMKRIFGAIVSMEYFELLRAVDGGF